MQSLRTGSEFESGARRYYDGSLPAMAWLAIAPSGKAVKDNNIRGE